MSQVDAMQLFKLANFCRLHFPNMVFCISRDCDTGLVVYRPIREGNVLKGEYVECHALDVHDVVLKPVASVLHKNFFKLETTPVAGTKYYQGYLKALPDRLMKITLKANKTEGKSDGKVAASPTFHLPDGGKIEKVELQNVFFKVVFNELNIPDVREVHCVGVVATADMPPNALAQFPQVFTKLDERQYLMQECIVVTDAMRKSYDPVSLGKQWLMGK
jgi:hypothetical protein